MSGGTEREGEYLGLGKGGMERKEGGVIDELHDEA